MQNLDQQKVKIQMGLATAGSMALASITGTQLSAIDPSIFKDAVEQANVAESGEAVRQEEVTGAESYQKVALQVDEAKFEKQQQTRFKQLAVKRAIGTVTTDENEEFAKLQESRRRAVETFNADGVLAEYRRRQMIIDVVQVLNRHVRFFKAEDQERIRAFGHTH